MRAVLIWLAIAAPLSVGLCFLANAVWPRPSLAASLGVGDMCGLTGLAVGGAIAFWPSTRRGRSR